MEKPIRLKYFKKICRNLRYSFSKTQSEFENNCFNNHCKFLDNYFTIILKSLKKTNLFLKPKNKKKKSFYLSISRKFITKKNNMIIKNSTTISKYKLIQNLKKNPIKSFRFIQFLYKNENYLIIVYFTKIFCKLVRQLRKINFQFKIKNQIDFLKLFLKQYYFFRKNPSLNYKKFKKDFLIYNNNFIVNLSIPLKNKNLNPIN